MTTLWINACIATMGADDQCLSHGLLATRDGAVQWVGAEQDLPTALSAQAVEVIDLQGRLVTPGLIDCHTHLVYGGNRAAEFERRLQGETYEQIARTGGGIRSTVAATRAASDEALFESARARLDLLMAEGVTAVEIKSGYGLDLEHERRMLAVVRRLGRERECTVRSSYLGAHALPPSSAGQADAYIDAVCDWLEILHREGLVDAVDAFCDSIAFSPAQTRRVFEAARRYSLPVKLHAEQLSNQGGSALAASFGALSCDHLEYLDAAGIAAMAASGSVAVLLPGAFHFLGETRKPPIQALRAAGVPMAVATDHNPGSSPLLSPCIAMNLACVMFGLTPWEALRGFTVHAARALGMGASHGRLAAGMRADFAVWDADAPRDLVYYLGARPARRVVIAGRTWREV